MSGSDCSNIEVMRGDKVLRVVAVKDDPSTSGCLRCVAFGDSVMCAALPRTCVTENSHYREVK